jgi:hypothetical protein
MIVSISEFQQRISGLLWNDNMLRDVANVTKNELQSWYSKLPEDWFDNPEPFPDGTPRHGGKRTFMDPLSTDWRVLLGQNGFDLIFAKTRDGGAPWGLRLQHYGGEIRPVRKRALTIPVTAEARGKSVRLFEQETGRNLFVVKGEAAKKNPDVIGSLVWDDPMGDLHAAYVLRKRSYVPPLKERRGHDAIPDEDLINKWAANGYIQRLIFEFNYA